MPTYEYACTSCGEHLEIVQSFRDDPLTECPACAGRLRKVFGTIGIAFKGSGFYKTDSRSSTSSSRTKDKDAAKAAAKADGASKGDAPAKDASASSGSSDGGTASSGKAGSDKAGGGKAGSDKAGGGSTKAAASS